MVHDGRISAGSRSRVRGFRAGIFFAGASVLPVCTSCGRNAPEGASHRAIAAENAAPFGPLASLVPPEVRSAPPTAGWNAAAIDWQPYEAGMARARAQHKPVCLVLYADWCPHCRNYSRVFDDPGVTAKSREFVMIRVDSDKEAEVNQRYMPDGKYVPRTLFLSPDGKLSEDIHAPRPKFLYFYDEHDPASLLAGMSEALVKLGKLAK